MADEPTLDRLRAALAAIEAAAAENAERSLLVRRRAADLAAALADGDSVAGWVRAEPAPRMVELLSNNLATLESAGAEFRAVQAIALRDEGLTIQEIADLFGVTRQRISALLRQRAAHSARTRKERRSLSERRPSE